MKDSGFVLTAYVSAHRQQGVVAEWSAYPPNNLATQVHILFSAAFSFLFFSEASSLKYAFEEQYERLPGGRVVNVATLPIMITRRG